LTFLRGRCLATS